MQAKAEQDVETTAPTDSTPIKKQQGGKRPGAGRKPDLAKRMIGSLKPATAREVLEIVDVEKAIRDIFAQGSLSLKQRTLADLGDRLRPASAERKRRGRHGTCA